MMTDIFKKISYLLGSQFRKKFVLVVILMLFSALLEVVSLSLILPLISQFFGGDSELGRWINPVLGYIKSSSENDAATVIAGLFMILYLFKFVYVIFMNWYLNGFIARLQLSLSEKLFNGYLTKPYSYHLNTNTSILLRNLTTEINAFSGSVLAPSMTIISEFIVLLFLYSMLLFISFYISISVIIFFGLFSILLAVVTKSYLMSWGEERLVHESSRIKHLQQGLGGDQGNKDLLIRELFH